MQACPALIGVRKHSIDARAGGTRPDGITFCTLIPQGTKVNSKGKEVPHGTRLYSIASSRYGDSFDGKTTTLCVRRALYWDPETGKEDPAKKGVCSNFLCDAKPGQEIVMTGGEGAQSSLQLYTCSTWHAHGTHPPTARPARTQPHMLQHSRQGPASTAAPACTAHTWHAPVPQHALHAPTNRLISSPARPST